MSAWRRTTAADWEAVHCLRVSLTTHFAGAGTPKLLPLCDHHQMYSTVRGDLLATRRAHGQLTRAVELRYQGLTPEVHCSEVVPASPEFCAKTAALASLMQRAAVPHQVCQTSTCTRC